VPGVLKGRCIAANCAGRKARGVAGERHVNRPTASPGNNVKTRRAPRIIALYRILARPPASAPACRTLSALLVRRLRKRERSSSGERERERPERSREQAAREFTVDWRGPAIPIIFQRRRAQNRPIRSDPPVSRPQNPPEARNSSSNLRPFPSRPVPSTLSPRNPPPPPSGPPPPAAGMHIYRGGGIEGD